MSETIGRRLPCTLPRQLQQNDHAITQQGFKAQVLVVCYATGSASAVQKHHDNVKLVLQHRTPQERGLTQCLVTCINTAASA